MNDNMSDTTRQKVGLTPRGELDDLGNAIGVSKMTPIISEIYKNDPILKAEKELLRTQAFNVEDNPFTQLGLSGLGEKGQILEPTYNMVTLKALTHQNNTLLQAVSAMEVNIDGTGYELARKDKEVFTEKDKEKTKKISEFFDEPWPGMSFITMRRAIRRDLETTGNAYLEVIRNKKGEIVFLRNIDSMLMRFMKLEDAIPVAKKIKRGGSEINVKVLERQRKFVQKIGDTAVRFFKEFGVDRELNAVTGQWENEPTSAVNSSQLNVQSSVTPIAEVDKANELLHFSVLKDVLTPYGVPRWINNLPSVLGSRKAEEFNLEFFDHGGLPPAMILIQGGQLSNEARTTLTNYMSGKAASKQRGIIAEIFAASGDLGSAGNVKVSVERFGDERQKDAMFATYDSNCAEHVRISFRLPPMFLGLSEAYNFACYHELTETLTDSGWCLSKDFKAGMKVAQVDPETGKLEYVIPSALYTYTVKNVEMYTFKNNTTDICVTPKHRMVWRGSPTEEWKITPVEDLELPCQFQTYKDPERGNVTQIITDIHMQNCGRMAYTGAVHCFTVPSGVYVTRYNGCVAIQGNTAYTAYMIAEAQVFLPERDEFDEVLNLTIMKELSDEYVFRSKSLNVVDVEAKLKAMELSKEFQNPSDFIDQLNEIVRANFTAKEGIDEQIIEQATAELDTAKENAKPKEVVVGTQGPQGGSDGRVLKLEFDDVMRELAEDWAGYLMGTLIPEDSSVKTMSKVINLLDPSVRKLFDGYVGMKMSSGGLDDDGVAELMSCVGHRHDNEE